MKKFNFKEKFGIKDILIFVGVASLFTGIWLIYPPAALIIIGAGLIYLGAK